jgi:hypothetical protein
MKRPGGLLLMGAHPGVNLGDRDRARSERLALIEEFFDEEMPVVTLPESGVFSPTLRLPP